VSLQRGASEASRNDDYDRWPQKNLDPFPCHESFKTSKILKAGHTSYYKKTLNCDMVIIFKYHKFVRHLLLPVTTSWDGCW